MDPNNWTVAYDEALIAEGSRVKDPLEFMRRLNELLLANVGQ